MMSRTEVDWMRVGQEDGLQPYIFRKAVEGTMSDRAALDQDASEEWCSSVETAVNWKLQYFYNDINCELQYSV